MPANKYTRSLYKTGTVASEKAAIANRDPARKAAAMKIMAKEGTTSPAGGRSAVKMPAKTPAPKPVQVIRTTVSMKPTPARERNSIRETRKK
jgi:endonuclease-3